MLLEIEEAGCFWENEKHQKYFWRVEPQKCFWRNKHQKLDVPFIKKKVAREFEPWTLRRGKGLSACSLATGVSVTSGYKKITNKFKINKAFELFQNQKRAHSFIFNL